jgi:hypothetical protein
MTKAFSPAFLLFLLSRNSFTFTAVCSLQHVATLLHCTCSLVYLFLRPTLLSPLSVIIIVIFLSLFARGPTTTLRKPFSPLTHAPKPVCNHNNTNNNTDKATL